MDAKPQVIRVLYVDDNPLDRALVRDSLEREHAGFTLDEAGTEGEFRARLRPGAYDVVLSDFNILGFEGLQVLDAVAATCPEVPVILVTGTGSEEVAVAAMKRGARDYVIKTPSHIQRLPHTVRAVVAQRRGEQERAESDRRYRELFENLPIGAFRTTPEGEILAANPAFWKLFGAAPGGCRAEELYQDPVEWRALLTRLEEDGQVERFQFQARRLDGTVFSAQATVRAVGHPGSGGAVAHEGVVADRSAEVERQHLEERLRHSQRLEAVGQLAGGVAHDFNNLLTVISGQSELLIEDGDLEGKAAEGLRLILRSSDRAAALTRQLLAFSRRQVLEARHVDLNAVVQDLGKMLHRLLGEHIDLVFELAPGLGSVWVDPGQLEQVIVNLAVNARDAMPQGGRLEVTTSSEELDAADCAVRDLAEPGPYAVLRVRDTGTGMDEATKTRIFEPFFTTKAPGDGTGLGLATVYGIVRQSRGHIWVYSELGTGSEFRVYLPVSRAPAPLASGCPKAPAPAPASGATVLVVEDDPPVRTMVTSFLRGSGYQVLEAGTPAEALALLDAGSDPVDLLLTDVVMPGMGGRRLAEQVKVRRPGLPVLYMSGYSDRTVATEGLLEPGIQFIQKPFTRAALQAKIEAVLARDR